MIIKKIILLTFITLILPKSISNASDISLEQRVINLDTNKYLNTVNLAKEVIASDELKIDKSKLDRLKILVEKNEIIINKLIDLQKIFKLNIQIKSDIRSNLKNRNSYFTIPIGRLASNEEISDLFLQSAKEDDYFFFSQYGQVRITTSYDPSKSNSQKYFVEKTNFDVTYRADLNLEYKVKNFVRDWVRENISPTMTDYKKVLAIHDFIVKKNNYNRGDGDELSGGFSIYHPSSILYGQGGVCNAYATLFDLMAQEAGLESIYLTGKSIKNGEDHIWNMVKIYDKWYHIDTTWDDPDIKFEFADVENLSEFIIYDYFLKSDDEIKKSRTINEVKERPQAPDNFYSVPDNSKIEKIDGKYWVVE